MTKSAHLVSGNPLLTVGKPFEGPGVLKLQPVVKDSCSIESGPLPCLVSAFDQDGDGTADLFVDAGTAFLKQNRFRFAAVGGVGAYEVLTFRYTPSDDALPFGVVRSLRLFHPQVDGTLVVEENSAPTRDVDAYSIREYVRFDDWRADVTADAVALNEVKYFPMRDGRFFSRSSVADCSEMPKREGSVFDFARSAHPVIIRSANGTKPCGDADE